MTRMETFKAHENSCAARGIASLSWETFKRVTPNPDFALVDADTVALTISERSSK